MASGHLPESPAHATAAPRPRSNPGAGNCLPPEPAPGHLHVPFFSQPGFQRPAHLPDPNPATCNAYGSLPQPVLIVVARLAKVVRLSFQSGKPVLKNPQRSQNQAGAPNPPTPLVQSGTGKVPVQHGVCRSAPKKIQMVRNESGLNHPCLPPKICVQARA